MEHYLRTQSFKQNNTKQESCKLNERHRHHFTEVEGNTCLFVSKTKTDAKKQKDG